MVYQNYMNKNIDGIDKEGVVGSSVINPIKESKTTTEIMTDENFRKETVPDVFPENSPLKRLVLPHEKVSRLVTEADLERVVEEVKILHAICFESYGPYHGAFAMHHSQIDDKDPLNFFVTAEREIIINPVIVRHSNYTIDSTEGCVTYPGLKQVVVQRWHKCDVEYVTIMTDTENKDKFKLSSKIEASWSGMDAKVFQHEFDHGNAIYIHRLGEPIEPKKD